MVSNRTSFADCRSRGFTLVEYMVATSIGLLILTVGIVFWAYATRTSASLLGYIDLSSTSKNALDRISQQIRNAQQVKSCSESKLVLQVPGATGTNLLTMTYDYDRTNKTLIQSLAQNNTVRESKTLLTECTNFQFAVFQRTPMSNSFQLITNAWSTNTAKVVQMKWTCVRKLTGDKNMIESQVSSDVVMRNP
jgi:prepilin-type N-terminal cleavage/methylation domain-containing protein